MNSSDKILLSSYLIKAAGGGLGRVGLMMAQQAARKTAPEVAEQGAKVVSRAARRAPKTRQPILNNVPDAAPTPTLPPPSFLTGQAAAPSLAAVAPTLPPPSFLAGRAVTPTLPPPSFLTEAAAPSLAAVAPAAAAAMPTGLGLARQGLGQVMAGTGQALRSGASTVRNRASNAASAVGRGVSTGAAATRRGLVSTAKNPLVQAGAVGLGGGALGTYGMLRAMGAGGAPAAAPSAGSADTGKAQFALYSDPDAKAVARLVSAPAAASASSPAAPAAASSPAAPAAAPAAASSPASQPDYNQFFKPYMGTNFDPSSRVDRAKLQFLKDLGQGGMDLSNVSGNYGEVYRRMQGRKF
jgi:hypothetical protein